MGKYCPFNTIEKIIVSTTEKQSVKKVDRSIPNTRMNSKWIKHFYLKKSETISENKSRRIFYNFEFEKLLLKSNNQKR